MAQANNQAEGIRCPKCGSSRLARYGMTPAGKQKYRCLECRRQFVTGTDHLLGPEKKTVVMRLLEADVEPTKIREAIPDISLRWIYELRRRLKRDRQR